MSHLKIMHYLMIQKVGLISLKKKIFSWNELHELLIVKNNEKMQMTECKERFP